MSWKIQAVLGTAGGVIAALLAPATIVAVAVYETAFWRGWSPTRARRLVVASWTTPVLAGLLGGWSLGGGWNQMVKLAEAHEWASVWVPMLPLMVPLGATAGAVAFWRIWWQRNNGVASRPAQAERWRARHWTNAMRRARREAQQPGLVPLTASTYRPSLRAGRNTATHIVLGRAAAVTQVGSGPMVPEDPRMLMMMTERLMQHYAVVGAPGKGKTEFLLRLELGWTEAAWTRYVIGTASKRLTSVKRPLTIHVDCKGGANGRRDAERWANAMERVVGIAPHRIGIFPYDTRLDLWALPPRRLTEVLVEMLKTDNVYFEGIQDQLVHMVVAAPGGAPRSSLEFVERLSAEWLSKAYESQPQQLELIAGVKRDFVGIAARYAGLFRRIGSQLDSGRPLDDFDFLSVTLPGASNEMTAAAQGQAVLELVGELANKGTRQILFVFDEFSAVSSRIEVTSMMERFRSLGCAVIPAAQSYQALGPTDDARKRLLGAAGGGYALLSMPDGEPFANMSGTAIAVETGYKLDEQEWSDSGSGRAQAQFALSPDRLREMGRHPGQVAMVVDGRVTWGVVTPIEVSEFDAPSWWPMNPLRKAVQRHHYSSVTMGDRIERAELEAGLLAVELKAARPVDEREPEARR